MSIFDGRKPDSGLQIVGLGVFERVELVGKEKFELCGAGEESLLAADGVFVLLRV